MADREARTGGPDGASGSGGSTHNAVSGGSVAQLVQAGTINTAYFYAPTPVPAAESCTPRQIRRPRGPFVNRTAELTSLTEAVDGLAEGLSVVVFTGLGGVGKTELIAHWAEREAERFPDGQLYADLGAVRHHGSVDLGEVLASFLRSLGVREEYVPHSLADRVNLFRSVTATRRLLFFLDNVEHAAEVRALLPFRGLVVVSSRHRLDGLVTDGAHVHRVEPLAPSAGVELVRRWLGEERGSDQELTELVRLCGGLPLALSAVGSQLLTRRRMAVGRVVAELADRHHTLQPLRSGESTVDEAFEAVYRTLPEQARRLYLLIGVHPGRELTPEMARALGGEGAAEAIDDLLAAHLLDETAPDEGPEERYRAHDLVALHARRAAGAALSDAEREAETRRIVDYFRVRAAAADRAVLGERFRLQESEAPLPPYLAFTGRAQALEWLQSERAELMAVVREAAARGWHGAVWRLCESLWALFHSRKHYADWIESHELGVQAARWDARPDVGIRMHNQLARAHYELGEYRQAAEQLALAAEQLPLVTDPRLGGVIWESQGLLALAQGEPGQAIALFTRAREANADDPHGLVVQGYNLAQALLAAGRHQEAASALAAATAEAARTQDEPMLMRLALLGGRLHRATGDPQQAIAQLLLAARQADLMKQHHKEDQALGLLVELAAQVGDGALERSSSERLLALRRSAGVLPPDPGADGP
ncbi:NB-ARC domain-containing protein [Kitasatospora sp. McL0602]|uniref:NB-ARC domain-containing protein n=1 Tax=Kitasatospora sp. McL0602 TaxID=3439530 RepID=UPI003F8C4A44